MLGGNNYQADGDVGCGAIKDGRCRDRSRFVEEKRMVFASAVSGGGGGGRVRYKKEKGGVGRYEVKGV